MAMRRTLALAALLASLTAASAQAEEIPRDHLIVDVVDPWDPARAKPHPNASVLIPRAWHREQAANSPLACAKREILVPLPWRETR